VLGYSPLDKNTLNFKQIENNIHDFINEQQFKKHKRFSIKDLHISNNRIYVSYTEEIKKDCWNMSILAADFNYSKINFKKFFSPEECIHSVKNNDNEFNAMQSGGRIITLDNNHIIFSTGEFRSRYLAQDIRSINGKLIKINIKSSNFKIISSGHRNVQGLLYDKDENFLLFTEHGPAGGDEINLLDVTKDTIYNYGWPS
jgi:glucose/arabinose dehydrogenase